MMPFCKRCGVEVESDKTHCPLCNTALEELDEESIEKTKKFPDDEQVASPKKERSEKRKRVLRWEILSVTLLIPLMITLFTDLIVNRTVSWSLYPISSLILVWIIISIPLLFPNKLPIILIGETVPYFIFLLIIDLIDNGSIDWYTRLGLPIIAVIITMVLAVIVGTIFVKNKGANIAAFILFGIGITCLGIDFIVTSYIESRFAVNWSLYVLASTVVLGGFLLYVHYRLIKAAEKES
jgi:hypothetical protein